MIVQVLLDKLVTTGVLPPQAIGDMRAQALGITRRIESLPTTDAQIAGARASDTIATFFEAFVEGLAERGYTKWKEPPGVSGQN